jgi:hypothetical protein
MLANRLGLTSGRRHRVCEDVVLDSRLALVGTA